MLPCSHLQVQDTWQLHLPCQVLQQNELCMASTVMEYTLKTYPKVNFLHG